MTKPTLTKEQAKKFVEGYNAKVVRANAGKTDNGRSPYRANSWADIGYEFARCEHILLQMARVKIVMNAITVDEANAVWMKG